MIGQEKLNSSLNNMKPIDDMRKLENWYFEKHDKRSISRLTLSVCEDAR